MIYIIISNIGLALITIVMYIRYSHFRISSTGAIKTLEKKLKKRKEDSKNLEKELREQIKKENDEVKSLLRELESSRAERQEEIRLRLEAEKQIELASQKILEVQSRVDDWKMVQDNALKNSQEAIFQFGNELINKLSSDNKRESDENRHFIEQNMISLHKDIISIEDKVEDFKKKISAIKIDNLDKTEKTESKIKSQETNDKQNNNEIDDEIEISDLAPKEEKKVEPEQVPAGVKLDEVAKKSLEDVVSLIEVSGLEHNKDYVLASKLDVKKAKFMLCDLIFVSEKIAYFIDFKADRYFKEYEKLPESEKDKALPIFKKKINKYLAYISNEKYKNLISKLSKALKLDYENVKIIFAVRNRDDLTLMKDLKYYEKCDELNIELKDVNGVNDLVL